MLTIALDSELITTFDPRSLIYLFDMIGIVACSISGTILAKHKNFDVFGCLLVSIVTAIGGGTVRDVILDCNEIPLVLQQEIYITAALTGGILYFALHNLGVTAWIADISAMATIFTLRMLAIRYDWQFPTIEWKY